MQQAADVVISGGGIAGASVAFHLSERGCTDVLVVEREAALGVGFDVSALGTERFAAAARLPVETSVW